MTVYARPGSADSSIEVKDRYEHYIGGEWVAPVKGDYFENITPVTGQVFTRIARGTAEDIDAALDAAHRAADAWGKTSATVSYTHLDVYKRQGSARRPSAASGRSSPR